VSLHKDDCSVAGEQAMAGGIQLEAAWKQAILPQPTHVPEPNVSLGVVA